MRIGMVGLGRMGMNMTVRLVRGGHRVAAFDSNPKKTGEAGRKGAEPSLSLEDLVRKLKPPRLVWIMLPAGGPVDSVCDSLKLLLKKGDTIIDGGNTHFRDDISRASDLKKLGIYHMDVGVSGGIWGLKQGYCLMAGGEKAVFKRLKPVFRTLAPKGGFLYCGPSGAGHYLKMIHNGIEYGMMSAYGEGFGLLAESRYAKGLDFGDVAELWNRGGVVRSWLLELLGRSLRKDPRLGGIEGYVEDSGEGRWMVAEALECSVPTPAITASLFQRFRSRQRESFSDKVLAALRSEFGGHSVRPNKSRPAGRKPKASAPG